MDQKIKRGQNKGLVRFFGELSKTTLRGWGQRKTCKERTKGEKEVGEQHILGKNIKKS